MPATQLPLELAQCHINQQRWEIPSATMMSDERSTAMIEFHHWKIAVDQCRQKHIGPPPPLYRRIAYEEAHRWAQRTDSRMPIRSRLTMILRRIWRSALEQYRQAQLDV
jgi:hypothetical protein